MHGFLVLFRLKKVVRLRILVKYFYRDVLYAIHKGDKFSVVLRQLQDNFILSTGLIV